MKVFLMSEKMDDRMNKNSYAGQAVPTDSPNSFSGQHDVGKYVPLNFPLSKARFVALDIWKFQISLELDAVSVFHNAV